VKPFRSYRPSSVVILAWASVTLCGASLSAQDVPVTTGGIISVAGIPPIYNGQYVLQTTDFGFLWLDTVALRGGLVQAESSCAPGMPPSNSGLYVIGDCNGTGSISSSGNVVLIRQFNSQCGTVTRGCNGSAIRGPFRLTFSLATWKYLGDGGDIPDSTQTADPQGRTWIVQPADTTERNFNWHATGNANTPPTAGATATNLSAESRTDKTNYYGDKWQLQDASVTAVPITRIDWDFIYKGAFSPDEVGAPSTEAKVTGYFPCDPSGTVQGSIPTGTNCMQSLGLTNSAATNSYRFAMQSANQNGTSTSPFISTAVQFVCPQASILGYTGFSGTCAKTSGTLGVLIGGNADASGSQGNLAEASVNWSFTGSNPINVQGAIAPVPSGATGFTLTITYPGGYRATAQGNIVQSSLVAAFSLAPDPILINSSLTLINQMQEANATLDSVNYVISPGTCSSSFGGFTSAPQLPDSFLTIGGTAAMQAPVSAGGYCVNLKYNYRPQSQPQQSQVVSNPFSTMNWTANPQIAISPVPFCASSCQLQAGTTYSLWDSESISVSPHPGAQWDLNGIPIGTSSDANVPVSWTPTSACSSCTLRVTVNGASATLPVAVSGSVVPTPTPTPTPTNTPATTNTPNNTATPTPTPTPTSAPATGFYTVSPCRVADTRNPAGPSGGPALSANTLRTFPVANICQIPTSARAVAINVGIVSPTDIGDLRVYPAGEAPPPTSTINFRAGKVRANNAIIALGTGGQIAVWCDMPSGSTNFFFEVSGYFQ
jgi:hypothetical protein